MTPTPPKRGFFSRLSAFVKAALIKAWFGGAVFYFVGWGLFIQSMDSLDLVIALGFSLGLVLDLLSNRALVFLERTPGEYRRFLLCYSKRFYSLPVNVAYGVILSLLIAYTYHLFNLLVQRLAGLPPGYIALGGEPILYGLLVMAYDMLFAWLKERILRSLRKEQPK